MTDVSTATSRLAPKLLDPCSLVLALSLLSAACTWGWTAREVYAPSGTDVGFVAAAIEQGDVVPGMTIREARLAAGAPLPLERTAPRYGYPHVFALLRRAVRRAGYGLGVRPGRQCHHDRRGVASGSPAARSSEKGMHLPPKRLAIDRLDHVIVGAGRDGVLDVFGAVLRRLHDDGKLAEGFRLCQGADELKPTGARKHPIDDQQIKYLVTETAERSLGRALNRQRVLVAQAVRYDASMNARVFDQEDARGVHGAGSGSSERAVPREYR